MRIRFFGGDVSRTEHPLVVSLRNTKWVDMASTLDALTVAFEEDGKLLVKEEARKILQDGNGWASIAFLSREWDPVAGSYSSLRVQLRRYRKRGGRYHLHAKFNLQSPGQAMALCQALEGWSSCFAEEIG